MQNLPFYIYLIFGGTVLLAVAVFLLFLRPPKVVTVVLIGWIIIQSSLAIAGFYTTGQPSFPRFPFIFVPPMLGIVMLFGTEKGRHFIDSLSLRTLTLFHIIRIPVEVTLLLLSIYKVIPTLMTFEGRNFDILSGLSAPVIYLLAFRNSNINRRALLIWNLVCLGLLLNIVVNAVLSIPTPFQLFAFGQPNIAVLYFPYVLLPSLLVPMVLLAHLASIRQLLLKPQIAK